MVMVVGPAQLHPPVLLLRENTNGDVLTDGWVMVVDPVLDAFGTILNTSKLAPPIATPPVPLGRMVTALLVAVPGVSVRMLFEPAPSVVMPVTPNVPPTVALFVTASAVPAAENVTAPESVGLPPNEPDKEPPDEASEPVREVAPINVPVVMDGVTSWPLSPSTFMPNWWFH